MKSHVKVHMKIRHLKLQELSDLSGVTVRTLMRARDDEQLRTCTIGTLEKIARVLGVSVNELFTDTPPSDGQS